MSKSGDFAPDRLPPIKTNENYCKVLGVAEDADEKTIIKAYRKLAISLHPDKPGGSKEKFQLLQEAHEILTNRRAAYDQRLAALRGHTARPQQQPASNVPPRNRPPQQQAERPPWSFPQAARPSKPKDNPWTQQPNSWRPGEEEDDARWRDFMSHMAGDGHPSQRPPPPPKPKPPPKQRAKGGVHGQVPKAPKPKPNTQRRPMPAPTFSKPAKEVRTERVRRPYGSSGLPQERDRRPYGSSSQDTEENAPSPSQSGNRSRNNPENRPSPSQSGNPGSNIPRPPVPERPKSPPTRRPPRPTVEDEAETSPAPEPQPEQKSKDDVSKRVKNARAELKQALKEQKDMKEQKRDASAEIEKTPKRPKTGDDVAKKPTTPSKPTRKGDSTRFFTYSGPGTGFTREAKPRKEPKKRGRPRKSES